MALTVADAKKVARKAAEKNLILAVGQQRHYNRIYDHALEMVRLDLLDQVHYIRAQWHVAKPEKKARRPDEEGRKKPRSPTMPRSIGGRRFPSRKPHAKFDGYDSPEELVRWQLYEKYSGGLLAELGSQLFGAAAMFVAANPNRDPERPYPLSVAGTGSQILRDQTCRRAISTITSTASSSMPSRATWTTSPAAQGPQEDRPAVRPDHRQRVRRLRRNGAGPARLAGAGERAEGDALSYLGRGQGPARGRRRRAPRTCPRSRCPRTARPTKSRRPSAAWPCKGPMRASPPSWSIGPSAASRRRTTRPKRKPRCDAEAGLYTTVLDGRRRQGREEGTRVDFKNEWFDVKSDETPDDFK